MKRVFTPSAIETMRAMAAEGKGALEIAAAIGSTRGSVRATACQLKIKIPKGQPGRRLVPRPADDMRRDFQISIQPIALEVLLREAATRQISPRALIKLIIHTVLEGQLVQAVLDD